MYANCRVNTSIWSLGNPFDNDLMSKIINYATKDRNAKIY